jgi:hypothetical protein
MPTAKIYSRGFIQNLLCIFLIFIQCIMKFGILNEFTGNGNLIQKNEIRKLDKG